LVLVETLSAVESLAYRAAGLHATA
jgi:hypothetical protein